MIPAAIVPWLIRGAAILAMLAMFAYGWHRFTEHYREQGRAEVQTQWDAARVAAEAQRQQQEQEWREVAEEAQRNLVRSQLDANERFAAIDAAAVPDRRVVVSGRAARVMRDSAAAANAAPAPAAPAGDKGAAQAVPESAQVSERELAQWVKEMAEAYRSAYDKWHACVEFYDGLR